MSESFVQYPTTDFHWRTWGGSILFQPPRHRLAYTSLPQGESQGTIMNSLDMYNYQLAQAVCRHKGTHCLFLVQIVA